MEIKSNVDTSFFEGSDSYLNTALKESVVLNIRIAKLLGLTKEEVLNGGFKIRKESIPYISKYWDVVTA